MKYITFIYQDQDDNDFIAVVPDLPGCVAYGDTVEEASKMMQETTELWLEGEDLPPANSINHFTDKVLNQLKIPLTASKFILHVTAEDHKSYAVELMDV